jgi:hypothetical protein
VSTDITHFLNVDLELVSDGTIDPLLDHWSAEVAVLRNSVEEGSRTAWLELNGQYDSPERVIVDFLKLIDALPLELEHIWHACSDRCFNVGIQAGAEPHSPAFSISSGTLGRIATVRARLELTVYSKVPLDSSSTRTA